MSLLLLLSDDAPNPRSLFAGGEQGVWYDPSDFSTLYQDSAGTTPVTAVGQPVGRILDKSGRGNHASQTTAASRPTLQQDSKGRYYLSFDGTDDGMATPSINFTGTDAVTVFAGVRKNSDAATGILAELSTNSDSTNGTFVLAASVSGNNYYAQSRGTVKSTSNATGYVAPHSAVLVAEAKISTDILRLHVNNAAPLSSATDQGTGNYGNYPLYIGRRGGTTFPFNGRLYQLIVRGAASNAGQIAQTEQYVNAKTGAY